MVKRGLIVIAIAAALFFISNLVQGVNYRRTTQAIIDNRTPTLFDSIRGYTLVVFYFPCDTLSLRIPSPRVERQEALVLWFLNLGNCLFWAIVVYSIVAFLNHYRRTGKALALYSPLALGLITSLFIEPLWDRPWLEFVLVTATSVILGFGFWWLILMVTYYTYYFVKGLRQHPR